MRSADRTTSAPSSCSWCRRRFPRLRCHRQSQTAPRSGCCWSQAALVADRARPCATPKAASACSPATPTAPAVPRGPAPPARAGSGRGCTAGRPTPRPGAPARHSRRPHPPAPAPRWSTSQSRSFVKESGVSDGGVSQWCRKKIGACNIFATSAFRCSISD